MASITKHNAGFRAQVFVKGVRDSKTFRTKREAEAWAHRREDELRRPTSETKTLRDALERYRDEVAIHKRGRRWDEIRIASFLADVNLPTTTHMGNLEAGVEPSFKAYSGASIVAYVLSANLHRRHLSAGQQAAIVASAQDWAKAQTVGNPSLKSQKCNVAPLQTSSDRAEQSGASLRTQKMADKVAKADPELAKQVAHGEVSLPKAVALEPEDFGRWRDVRLKSVSAGTVLREFGLLSAVLETARREWRWIAVNPIRDVRKPREPDHRETTLISTRQTLAMLRVMGYRPGQCKSATHAVCVAFLLALRTGMRAGELCGLRWVDISDGCARVTGIDEGAGKTRAARRDVPLIFQSRRLIESMRGWDDEFVFGISSQTLDALFRRYRKRSGLSGFVFHDTRHTAATLLARKVDVLTLCKIMGWKNTKQALVYFNPSADSIRRRLEPNRPRI